MKAGWQVKTLGEVCEAFLDGDWIESKDQSTLGIRLIQTGNVGVGSFKDREEKARYISDSTFTRLRCTEIFEGDCLISRLPEPVGRACILPAINSRMITAVDCTIARFNSQLVLPLFFNYYAQSNIYLQDVNAETTGTTRKRISRSKLGEIEIPIPPLAEQQRIVALLDEAFASIDAVKANAEQNLDNARELFDSYLAQVFSQRGEGWVEKKIGAVCSLYQGLAINAKTKHLLVEKSNLPLLRIKDLRNNTVEQFVAETGYPKNALVNEDEIIYTRTGQIGLVFLGRKGILHNNCFKIIPNQTLKNEYLFWCLQNPLFYKRVTSLAFKAAQPDITHAIFKEQNIIVPPINWQTSIVEKINALSAETKKLEALYRQKIAALDELKQSLLHQAFIGEL